MTLFWIVILIVIIQPSYQRMYSCNSNSVCGCSSKPASVARILGGEDAGISTWGWAVSLSINDTYLCGGSILSSSWIITAAHCVYDNVGSSVTVYAGSTMLWSGTQSRKVSQVIVHSKYNVTGYINDIALLRLTSPLDMSDPAVAPICLPSVNSTILATNEWPPVNTTVNSFQFQSS
jgi:secreted trypsin-like serine protease